MFEFKTKGSCSKKIHFDIRENKVCGVSFEKGCDGNLKALSALVEGMNVTEVISRLKGIRCGERGTSCGGQLALALMQQAEAGI
jgi:uncharacterized protein (TIGR03905 family)